MAAQTMTMFMRVVAAGCLVAIVSASGAAQAPGPDGVVGGVWHLGRVTGDLDRIIRFYCDALGLSFRGERGQPIAFYSVAAINEFVHAPAHAEFRAAFLPIQGTSAAARPQDQIYFEALEYRNIDRRQELPALSRPGASSLRLLLSNLDATLAAAKAAGVAAITAGGAALQVPTPAGIVGVARASMVRDPDGYPVELMEIMPAPESPAPPESRVLGAHMTVTVRDLDASIRFYQRFVGTRTAVWRAPSSWQTSQAFTDLRQVPRVQFRTAAVQLPGSAVVLELVEFRGAPDATPYRPVFQDIGTAHVAFTVPDVQAVVARMTELGARSIAASGTWTQINPTTRAVYTRDPDGFFLEILERR